MCGELRLIKPTAAAFLYLLNLGQSLSRLVLSREARRRADRRGQGFAGALFVSNFHQRQTEIVLDDELVQQHAASGCDLGTPHRLGYTRCGHDECRKHEEALAGGTMAESLEGEKVGRSPVPFCRPPSHIESDSSHIKGRLLKLDAQKGEPPSTCCLHDTAIFPNLSRKYLGRMVSRGGIEPPTP